MNQFQIDINENTLQKMNSKLLPVLLKDRSSGKNIIWATDIYASRGGGYQKNDSITISSITGYYGQVIKPRIVKSKKEQNKRIKQKAEVFTPAWVCNKQNNLVDNVWFGKKNVFNLEQGNEWSETVDKIPFPTVDGKTWQDYVLDTRLEITCGEAPYLVSRYDTVTGELIELSHRIGILDRKIRVVNENTTCEKEWIQWAKTAFQSTYGYEWQGDNVLIARENLLLSYIDYYTSRFHKDPSIENLLEIEEILSWNIWQMDGLKFVIPDSCEDTDTGQLSLFQKEKTYCEGCATNNPFLHRGTYCKIRDWKANKTIKFVSLLKKGKANES